MLPLPPEARGAGRDEWELSLTAASFESCLSAEADWVTVWEDSTEQYYDQSQDIADLLRAGRHRAQPRPRRSAADGRLLL